MNRTTAALAALLAVVHLLPEHLAAWLQHSHKAWESVLYGLEAAVLWLLIGASARWVSVQAVSAWGATEGGMRAMCRLALPMDRPPALAAGKNLCDVVTGLPASWFSLAAALMVACIAQEEAARHGTYTAGR